jgi:S-DNA-T family DNA segregation ATPase FtsK/SpoIIIE
MAARTKKSSTIAEEPHIEWPAVKWTRTDYSDEALALALLFGGAVFFFALISYVPGDVPAWLPFADVAPPNDPAKNFVGRVGAIVAGFSYFLFGLGSVPLATLLFACGGVKLADTQFNFTKRLPAIGIFIVATACMADLQPWFFPDWAERFNMLGPGGWVGWYLGRQLLASLLGPVGSGILLFFLYLISIMLMTGLRPGLVIRRTREGWRNWIEARRERRLAKASELERLALEEKRLEESARKAEKEMEKAMRRQERETRKAAKAAAAEHADAVPSEFADLPEVVIYDSTAPPNRVPSADLEVPVAAAAGPANTYTPPTQLNPFSSSGSLSKSYRLPTLDLLEAHNPKQHKAVDPEELKEMQNVIIDTLKTFGISVAPGNITKGPTITRYEVYPAVGVRVDKIVSLEKDLARATRAESIHILAPIPGKDTVGIEIANNKKVVVTLRELLESDAWQTKSEGLPLALGKDVYGKTIVADLARMPHCLVAGATGSGKSVCINSIVASIIYRYTPEDVRFIMIDPKVVELQLFNRLPHMAVPVVTDPKKVLLALRWVINEMEKRYRMFAIVGCKNLNGFNTRFERTVKQREKDKERAEAPDMFEEAAAAAARADTYEGVEDTLALAEEPEEDKGPTEMLDGTPIPERLPFIVVIIDELADLMQTAPADVENGIARIAQMGRAAGIHLILATQTPRADVITGIIKANIPVRVAFQVSNKIDSRVILDVNGAERLLGQGDMFYMPPGTSKLTRAQGAYVTEREMSDIVDFIATQAEPEFDLEIQEQLSKAGGSQEEISEEDEELIEKCMEVIRQEKKASTSMLQRRLRLGYTRAARIVDILEERGILGPGEGAKPREILVDLDARVGYSGYDNDPD